MKAAILACFVATAAVGQGYPARGRISGGSTGTSSTVTPPATGAGVDTCTGNGCAIGPSGISTDGGVTLTGAGNLQLSSTVDKGIFWGNGSFWAADSSGPYCSNTGTRVFETAGSGGCDLGGASRQWGNVFANGLVLSNVLTYSGAAPTISSGFGSSPSIVAGTGAGFSLNVGTGGTASTGVINIPVNFNKIQASAAVNGWVCECYDLTNPGPNKTAPSGSLSTTTCTITNYSQTTGIAAAWSASDILVCQARGF